MGLLTGLLAMLIANWYVFSGNQQLEQIRCILLFFVVFAIIINLMFVGSGSSMYGSNKVDSYGHLGGALTGLFWGMAVLPRTKS